MIKDLVYCLDNKYQMDSTMVSRLKVKYGFLDIKPHSKDIYDHMQWPLAQFWELELAADVTASWKQRRSMYTQTAR